MSSLFAPVDTSVRTRHCVSNSWIPALTCKAQNNASPVCGRSHVENSDAIHGQQRPGAGVFLVQLLCRERTQLVVASSCACTRGVILIQLGVALHAARRQVKRQQAGV